jgi:hypothetical protein
MQVEDRDGMRVFYSCRPDLAGHCREQDEERARDLHGPKRHYCLRRDKGLSAADLLRRRSAGSVFEWVHVEHSARYVMGADGDGTSQSGLRKCRRLQQVSALPSPRNSP